LKFVFFGSFGQLAVLATQFLAVFGRQVCVGILGRNIGKKVVLALFWRQKGQFFSLKKSLFRLINSYL